jgi:antitoxin HigA-1
MTLKMSKSPTTTKKDGAKLLPIRPGDILHDEFMEPLGLSATKLAHFMGIAPSGVTAILDKKISRAITAKTALRLACVFGTSPDFWLNLQSNYEVAMLDYTGQKDKILAEARELARA